MTGSYNTMVGNNEGSMVSYWQSASSLLQWETQGYLQVLFWFSSQVLGLKLPNVFGRAEKLTFQFSYGTKETSYGLSFFKPQPGHFERKYVSWHLYFFLQLHLLLLEMLCCPSQSFQLVIKFPVSDIKFHVVCNIESSVILSRFAAMYFMRKFIIFIGYWICRRSPKIKLGTIKIA